MEFSMQYATNGPAEVAAADDPGLRFFNVEKTVAGKPQEDVGGRWKAARPQNVQDFSAVGYFFGRELRKVLNVPVGLIHNAWGGTPAESWTSYETLESDPEYQPILDRGKAWLATAPKVVSDYQEQFDQWKRAADQAESEGRPIPPFPKAPHEPRGDAWQRPSGLFNGMVMPLRNYRIAGVIWYQGEANTPRALQYRKLFPAMIGDWRRAWGEGDLPFLYVQLAYFLMGDAQADLNWALLQEAQLKTLSVPKTAMAVAADIGDAGDIHPKNKSDVGYRLALAAQAIAYGRDIPYSGPIYDSMSIEGAKIRLRFQHVYGGLIAKGSGDVRLARFQIAGDDHKFEVGEAKIEGETVVVSSPKVPNPVAVRYGFPWSPQCNLYNQVGLPASPFRTDDWPITVTGN
jgi:sialate O-acetylesterase